MEMLGWWHRFVRPLPGSAVRAPLINTDVYSVRSSTRPDPERVIVDELDLRLQLSLFVPSFKGTSSEPYMLPTPT
jgi:hypothetical protein